jgi:TRAP-type C4-dicarboxylate transport system permease small subunit
VRAQRLAEWTARAGSWAAGLCLAGIVGAVALQVLCRYGLNAPLRWPEEVSRLLLVWLTYLGALTLPDSQLHVALDVVYRRMPPRARRTADLLGDLVGLGFFGILAVAGLWLVLAMQDILLPALQVPLNLLLAIVPVTSALQAYLHAVSAVHRVQRTRSDAGAAH